MPNPKIVQVNTQEEVTAWLAQALQCVDNAGIPEPYGEMAFAKAVDLLAAKRMEIEQPSFGIAVPGIG